MRITLFALVLVLALAVPGCSENPGTGAGDPAAGFEAGRAALRSGDPAAALEHFRPAAEAGHAGAAFCLGVLHALGQGVTRDAQATLAWYRRAAELGGPEAQYNLGVKLDEGVAPRADEATAARWLERLARLGEETNPLRVGSDYPFGAAGLVADAAEAARWFERAARRGHGLARYRLGLLHAIGRGVPRDLARAHAWLGLCAEIGLGDSAARVAALAAEMTPEELAASRALAEGFRAALPEPATNAAREATGD